MIAAGRQNRTDFLAGTGEMGGRIRGFDWAATPLGSIEVVAGFPQNVGQPDPQLPPSDVDRLGARK